jgi:hypothetical protein
VISGAISAVQDGAMDTSGALDWDLLLKRIKRKNCTPFIGAGASADYLPVGAEIAGKWAEAEEYPFPDATDLTRVAQYLAVIEDPMSPKLRIIDEINDLLTQKPVPTPMPPDQPHAVLAALDLPIYLTTNYDGLMAQALRERGKDVKESICLWNDWIAKKQPERFRLTPDYRPTPEAPLVYHLHGHLEVPTSLVLTEDDYIDFLTSIGRKGDLLPPYIEESLTGSSMLFVGYRILDANFRVLFRSLVNYMQDGLKLSHFSVQSAPRAETFSEEERQRATKYLTRYFDRQLIAIFWGRSQEFAKELGQRWQAANDGD